MECINWVASSTFDADSSNTMYNRWSDGSPAMFYWFDPVAVLDADTAASTKWATKALTMKYNSENFAQSLALGATALLLASALAF